MQNIIKTAINLGLWCPLNTQFATMLTSHLPTDTEQYKKTALILASASLSAYINCGHTCLPLYMLAPDKLFNGKHPELAYAIYKKIGKLSTENWQELLLSLSSVSNGSHLSPLILENKYLYLHRMWKDENIIAKFFNSKNHSDYSCEKKILTVLNKLFSISNKKIDWAKIASAISLIKQKVLISGGPGTGKTFTITKIIAAFLLLTSHKTLNIRMAAPTGKAAARLTESFRLTIDNVITSNNKYIHSLPEQATTIHNLLGARLYKKNTIMQYECYLENPLHIDILIIDEASMISLSILAQLILALPKHAKIILLGDHNQLHPVEPGSVFKDILKYANFNHYSLRFCETLAQCTGYDVSLILDNTSIPEISYNNRNNSVDNICILKKNYRFNQNSGIHQLSIAIKAGKSDQVLSLLASRIYSDIYYLRCAKNKDYINMIFQCTTQYYRYLQTIKQCTSLHSIINILKIFNQYRILCALNDGPFGIIKINYYIEQILCQKGLITLNNKSKNYIGRPIIILHNAPSLNLFNGDTGMLLLNDKNILSAYFLYSQNIVNVIPIHQLPQYDTCFAMTIHKSQGSEFPNIAIVLPNKNNSLLTRELLYTAVTRASNSLVLYATDPIIANSVNLVTQRYSGLQKKLNLFNK